MVRKKSREMSISAQPYSKRDTVERHTGQGSFFAGEGTGGNRLNV